MKTDRGFSPQAEIEFSAQEDAFPTMDELKMEYLEYLLETDVRNAPNPFGIDEISAAALAERLSLFSLGGPPPQIFLNKKIRICH